MLPGLARLTIMSPGARVTITPAPTAPLGLGAAGALGRGRGSPGHCTPCIRKELEFYTLWHSVTHEIKTLSGLHSTTDGLTSSDRDANM